ncbi:MAG: rhomboid family intramembrane serine protease [Acidobacteriota bacterium]
MFPYHDENETERTPIVTIGIIAINVLVWFLVQGAGATQALAASVCNLGLIAGELTGALQPGVSTPLGDGLLCVIDQGPELSHLFTSMFLHGGWMHLLGNMWFLWLFGNNIEDSMTRPRFAIFYLTCGLAAAFMQVFSNPASSVPMIGASGAISGVMGAYLVLYPRVKVYTILPLGFFSTTYALPAWVMLLYWIFLQVIGGFGASEGGVAFWAHVGGFIAGIVLVKLFSRRDRIAAHSAGHFRPVS